MQQLETARRYRAEGLQSFALPSGSKRPAGPWKAFTEKPNTEAQLVELFSADSNIAVVAGAISGNLAILDFDSMSAFERYRRDLIPILNIAPVSRTGRGVHIWIRTPFTPRTSKPAHDIDVKGQGGYIVAPRSLHPSGVQYEFWDPFTAPPLIDPAAIPFPILPWIPEQTREKGPGRVLSEGQGVFVEAPKPYGIPAKLWAALRGDFDREKYASRSEAEFALVVWAVNNRWSPEEIESLFFMHAGPGSKFRTQKSQNPETARKWILNLYDSALRYLAENRRHVDRELDRFSALAEFGGRTKYTDQAVFSAIITIARRSGKLEKIGASIREVAALAGIEIHTARRSLHRIPWIRKDSPGEGEQAAGYKLLSPLSLKTKTVKDCGHGVTTPPRLRTGDIWTRGGLGVPGRLIFDALGDTPKTAAQLGKDTGVGLRTVFRKLAQLGNLGAAIPAAGGWIRGTLDEQAAAESLGVAGTLERRKAQHERDRKIYRAYLEKRKGGRGE